GRPAAVLRDAPVVVPDPGAGDHHAHVGRGDQGRHAGTAADPAADAVAGDARQVPRRMAVHRAGAGTDLSDLDHRQLPGRAGQRRDPGRLPGQLADGRQLHRPRRLINAVAHLSMLRHFEAISRGVLDLRDLLYFVLSTLGWLVAGVLLLDLKRTS